MVDHYLEHNQVRLYDFDETPLLSTYLYTINAGPYSIYKHKKKVAGQPAQRVFYRATCSKVVPHHITNLVENTIVFYEEELFGTKFPFPKLDHVLCPDVRYAAMESAGCITYSEVSLSNKLHSQMSTCERILFHMIIQHELAHQWFGNKITMKWWNDIWLNESFASLIGYIACEKV